MPGILEAEPEGIIQPIEITPENPLLFGRFELPPIEEVPELSVRVSELEGQLASMTTAQENVNTEIEKLSAQLSKHEGEEAEALEKSDTKASQSALKRISTISELILQQQRAAEIRGRSIDRIQHAIDVLNRDIGTVQGQYLQRLWAMYGPRLEQEAITAITNLHAMRQASNTVPRGAHKRKTYFWHEQRFDPLIQQGETQIRKLVEDLK